MLPWELSVFLQTDPSCTISTGLQILYIKSASTQEEPPTREEGEMRHGLLGSGTAHQMNLEEKEVWISAINTELLTSDYLPVLWTN